MQQLLCKGMYYDHECWYMLEKLDGIPYKIVMMGTGAVESRRWVASLGTGIDMMVRFCNLPYPGVLDLVQQAIRKMHIEERLCSASPHPATDSCTDTGACGQ